MARYSIDPLRLVTSGFDDLTLNAQWLYLRLRTSPLISPAGVTVENGPLRRCIGGDDAYEAAMAELDDAGWVFYDADTGEILLPGWLDDENIAAHPKRLKALAQAAWDIYSDRVRGTVLAFWIWASEDAAPTHRRRKVASGVKAQVFARDGLRCVSCGTTEHLTIDHIIPVAKGGTNDIGNLQTMCRSCNSRKYTS